MMVYLSSVIDIQTGDRSLRPQRTSIEIVRMVAAPNPGTRFRATNLCESL